MLLLVIAVVSISFFPTPCPVQPMQPADRRPTGMCVMSAWYSHSQLYKQRTSDVASLLQYSVTSICDFTSVSRIQRPLRPASVFSMMMMNLSLWLLRQRRLYRRPDRGEERGRRYRGLVTPEFVIGHHSAFAQTWLIYNWISVSVKWKLVC